MKAGQGWPPTSPLGPPGSRFLYQTRSLPAPKIGANKWKLTSSTILSNAKMKILLYNKSVPAAGGPYPLPRCRCPQGRSASGGPPSGYRDVQFLWDYPWALLGGGQVVSGIARVGSAGSRRHATCLCEEPESPRLGKKRGPGAYSELVLGILPHPGIK